MKVAVFTPLNPARSGIADYSEALLPHLSKHLEIEVFIDDYEPTGFPPGVDIPIRNYREFQPLDFDVTLYQFGNNPYHIYIYDQALKHPGVALMHEFNMHHLVADATIKRGDWDAYLRELEHDGGPGAADFGQRVRALEVGPDYEGVAMNRRILEQSQAAIVHSRFLVDEIDRTGQRPPVCVIPHGASIPEVNRNHYRHLLGVEPETPLIGVFGFLKPYKRIAESLRAMRRLIRLDSRVKMILVGEEHPDFPVSRLVARMGLENHVRILGYVPLDEFVQYIGAVDICLNLRYPTAGEMSGTLQRALALGKAVLVSDVGAFSYLPDEVCFKVPVGPGEVDLLTEYLHLLTTKPEVARAVGLRAQYWVGGECSWERVAERYAAWLRAVASEDGAALEPLAEKYPSDQERGRESGVKDTLAFAAAAPVAEAGLESPITAEFPPDAEPEPAFVPPARPALLQQAAEAPVSLIPSAYFDFPATAENNGDPRERLASSHSFAPLVQPPPAGHAQRMEWANYIRGYCADRPASAPYIDTHMTRLIRTIELTPPGGPNDKALEMGAYMHITPALHHRLGYGEVRGCYLGPVGKVDRRKVTSSTGEEFECEIDLFDAENDDYPYPDETFATVLCGELIEHLYDDPMHLMAEVNRILRPGGHLVLSTPNACSLRAIAAILLRYHPGLFHHYVAPDKDGNVDPRHAREYAPLDVQALLEAAGFSVEILETGAYAERPSREQDWVEHLLKRYDLPRDLRGESVFAVGRKSGPVRERYPPALYERGAV